VAADEEVQGATPATPGTAGQAGRRRFDTGRPLSGEHRSASGL